MRTIRIRIVFLLGGWAMSQAVGCANASIGEGPGGAGAGGTGGSPFPKCGMEDLPLQRGAPADLLIVLDRSRSMDQQPPGGGGSKWSQVSSALGQAVPTLQDQIRWGLELFPTESCGDPVQVRVGIAMHNAAAITMAIGSESPNGAGTPTVDALHAAGTYMRGLGDTNPKYVLLATDGEPTCGSGGGFFEPDDMRAEQAVADLAASGVHTFVIGISTDPQAEAVLNQMAVNGGEPRGGAQKYFPVQSGGDLTSALRTIAGQITSCSLTLTKAPPYPGQVDISISGQSVPRDTAHMNGWDFGPGNQSIQLYGSWCQRLQSGMIDGGLHATFGCPPAG